VSNALIEGSRGIQGPTAVRMRQAPLASRLKGIRMLCFTTIASIPLSVGLLPASNAVVLQPFAAEDVLVCYDKTKPDWMYGIEVTDDDKYVVISIVQDTSRVSPTSAEGWTRLSTIGISEKSPLDRGAEP
jgi:Prolyl oligopeptidase, N-terminal beta-propeller domain